MPAEPGSAAPRCRQNRAIAAAVALRKQIDRDWLGCRGQILGKCAKKALEHVPDSKGGRLRGIGRGVLIHGAVGAIDDGPWALCALVTDGRKDDGSVGKEHGAIGRGIK